jgi:hypothetical protein
MPVSSQWFANPGVTYEIDNSCRFDGSSSYMSRTPASAGNRKTWTQSAWVKRCKLDAWQYPFMNTDTGGNDGSVFHSSPNAFEWLHASYNYRETDAALQDVGGWYHIVWNLDTTLSASAAVRSKCWINGVEQTYRQDQAGPDEDLETQLNNNVLHGIGRNEYDENGYFDGYLAEYIFIDGTALTAASFGETNSTTGQWVPKDPSGLTFGTNGFWLDFANSSALGNDVSGNDNDWATSGLAAADRMVDSPTDNAMVANSLPPYGTLSFSNTNTTVTCTATGWETVVPSFFTSSGKYKAEFTFDSGDRCMFGACSSNHDYNNYLGQVTADGFGYGEAGDWYGGDSGSGTSYTHGDVISIFLNMDVGAIWAAKDGTLENGASYAEIEAGTTTNAIKTGLTGSWGFAFAPGKAATNSVVTSRFDQAAWTETDASGYAPMSTALLDDPTIADPSAYFQTTLYTGNGSTQSIDQGENSTFSPDLVWLKNRDAADNHCVFDSVRGATKVIFTNESDAQTTDADTLTAFDSDGFSLGDDDKVNTNTEKYVGWQWLESNTPALDIVQYEGTGSKQTISHGLGVAPDLIIFKNIDSAQGWAVYHRPLGPEYEIRLSTATAAIDDAAFYDDDNPTSSVFTVNTNSAVNGSGNTHIAYVFAEVEGFSEVGKYTGNGNADGPFVWCGFRPEMVIIKNASSAENWAIHDTQRSPYNVVVARLEPSANDAEATNLTVLDFLSNGFKIRGTDGMWNSDGDTYIFAAFAETPFKTANAR